jgi:signal transduction histidine kinase
MGIGLAITRSMIDAHGGHLAHNNPNGGSTFSVTLPIGDDRP